LKIIKSLLRMIIADEYGYFQERSVIKRQNRAPNINFN